MDENYDSLEIDKLVIIYSEFEDEFEHEFRKTKIQSLDVIKKFETELTNDLYNYPISKKIKFTKKAFFDFYSNAYL